jgi:RNAse (barnase) inhibitor barstar
MIAPGISTIVTWRCVHFGTLLEGRKEIELCKERGFTAIQVDLTGIQENEALLAKIASAMKFPEYFGMNWDAMDECLRDLSWLNPKGVLLVLENSQDVWRQPTLAGQLVGSWLFCAESWAQDGVPFHLGFTWD